MHTIDLTKKGLKLKIGPIWCKNESEIHLVYGVTEEDSFKKSISELHFNFGGNIDCENKTISNLMYSLLHFPNIF